VSVLLYERLSRRRKESAVQLFQVRHMGDEQTSRRDGTGWERTERNGRARPDMWRWSERYILSTHSFHSLLDPLSLFLSFLLGLIYLFIYLFEVLRAELSCCFLAAAQRLLALFLLPLSFRLRPIPHWEGKVHKTHRVRQQNNTPKDTQLRRKAGEWEGGLPNEIKRNSLSINSSHPPPPSTVQCSSLG